MTPPTPPESPAPSAATTPPPTTVPAPPVDNTKAIVSLVLGILSMLCCGFFTGIPAIFVSRSEMKAINEGRSSESNRALAKIGLILGIIGTILSILGALAYGAIIVLAIISGKSTPSSF